jgi:hypothetical protein
MPLRDKVEKYCRAGQAANNSVLVIWHMHTARWMPKAIDTHSEYVILIPFPWGQWLREGAPVIHYTTLPLLFFLVKATV